MAKKIFRNLLIGIAVASSLCACSTTQCAETGKSVFAGRTLSELSRIETHYLKTQEDFEGFNEILENRNWIVVEISNGTVLDDDGNGVDDGGFYICYDNTRFAPGERVRTMCIYNPDTNYIDDIIYRADFLIK